MTTPANDTQNKGEEQKEPKDKGGVVGTDSKEFSDGDRFENPPKPEHETPAHSETK